ncbi:hypothetical protein MAIT1_02094 [Magnetofaba australis IT-1]|uniref:DUF4384 domain-containing protein n=1 Tax=Magnetofaba australis IT-1 TaxID=1434232 RepID=A0A1Y2K319_9PROT|nr:hypothetical protein MAIT1_02094 [Magnetofaba australis IT-1]
MSIEEMFAPAFESNMGAPASRVGMATRGIAPDADKQKRSLIWEADGYAKAQPGVSGGALKQKALQAAKTAAFESAKAFLDGQGGAASAPYRFPQPGAAGVKVLQVTDHGMGADGRYHVWIKGELSYLLDQQQSEASMKNAAGPLSVRVWTERKRYRQGEQVVVNLQGNRDFHARVFTILSNGAVLQLAPNAQRKSDLFDGGLVHQLPDMMLNEEFRLTVAPPFGEDRILVFASEKPLADIATKPAGQGLSLFPGTGEQLRTLSRRLMGGAGATGNGGAELVEAEWRFATTAR